MLKGIKVGLWFDLQGHGLMLLWLTLVLLVRRTGPVLVAPGEILLWGALWLLRHLIGAGLAPVAMPTFATAAFWRYFGLGRPVRGVLPLGNGRLMHLVVACGFQGADENAEKLNLSDQLFDAALCELAVTGKGQPC